MTRPNTYRAGPDSRGRFGSYGGRFVAETLMPLILELERAYEEARDDPAFGAELAAWLADYAGRPTPLYLAERLSAQLGGARVYFKRDELAHTGAHKINNTIGQILLARRMGKRRIIAETGAGQHGVATATVAARLGLECIVYMGARDIERQRPNVFRMRLLGAEVRAVKSGSATLKDAMNEALRDWVSNVESTFYIIGSVAGPHPYPAMVRDFQAVIGNEVREQIMAKEGRLPDVLVACIGGGSNAIGLFHPFLDEPEVRMIGVEAAGHGVESGAHAAALIGRSAGRPARLALVSPAGRRRPGARGAFDLRRTGLSGRRAGARLAEGHRSRRVRPDHRRRGPWRVSPVQRAGRHSAGARAGARARAGGQDCAGAAERPSDRHESLRPGRQGHLHRGGCHGGHSVSGRIERRFAELAQAGRGGLITFLCAGDPDPKTSAELVAGLPAAGADVIEIGMPFSDPMADGPAIQAGSLRALEAGMTLAGTLDLVRALRRRDEATPVVLMGYFNPIWRYGPERFLDDAREAGVDGLIVVDLPPEEDDELCVPAQDAGLAFIRLVTPTTDDERLPKVLANAKGFLYYVSITGITGTRAPIAEQVAAAVARLRRHTRLPVAVGFGIRTPAQAAAVAKVADAVVIGSALVSHIAASLDSQGRAQPGLAASLLGQVNELAAAVRNARNGPT